MAKLGEIDSRASLGMKMNQEESKTEDIGELQRPVTGAWYESLDLAMLSDTGQQINFWVIIRTTTKMHLSFKL